MELTRQAGRRASVFNRNRGKAVAILALPLLLCLVLATGLTACTTEPPQAQFAATPISGYLPVEVQFTDLSQGDVNAWEWDFDGDKQVDSTLRNPVRTYANPGTYTVSLKVTGPGGSDTTSKPALLSFTIPPPQLTGVSPASARRGDTVLAAISGESLSGASTVRFTGGIAVNRFIVVSPNRITASIEVPLAANLGASDVVVSTPGGRVVLSGGFSVMPLAAPVVAAANRASGNLGETLSVLLSGTNFERVDTIDFGPGIYLNSFTIDTSTRISATISVLATATPGARDISVSNSGGTGVLDSGFTVTVPPPPTVTGVDPEVVERGETFDVVVHGTALTAASELRLRSGVGVTVNGFIVDDSTQITANVTTADDACVGPGDVLVITPGGSGTLHDGFSVLVPPAPTITRLSPSSGNLGADIDVVIEGTDFIRPSELSFGEGITVHSFTGDSPTRITAQVTISSNAELGSRSVSVRALGGASERSNAFSVTKSSPCTAAFVAEPTVADRATKVEFTNQSTGDITNYYWDFNNDGITDSTEEEPSHTYGDGVYSVKLTVSGPTCEDTLTMEDYIQVNVCQADFTATPTQGKGVTTVRFTDSSRGELTGWEWDLDGDGISDSFDRNPTWTYVAEGNYSVTLTVSGPRCADSRTRLDYIKIIGCTT